MLALATKQDGEMEEVMLLEQKQRWDALFDLYNSNGDGVLSEYDVLQTFSRACEMRGWREESTAARELLLILRSAFLARIQGMDLDGEGKISQKRWREAVEKSLNRGGGYVPCAQTLESAQALFQSFDFDADGAICAQDYFQFLRLCGSDELDKVLQEHWKILCARYSNSDTLTYHQFLAAHLEMLCSTAPAPFWTPARDQ